MYCDSEQARIDYKYEVDNENETKKEEIEYQGRRRETLLKHIERAKETNPETYQLELTKEEQAIKEACSSDENGFNAPM